MGHDRAREDDHATDRERSPWWRAANRDENGGAATTPGPPGLLDLQRSAGNRSVVRLLEDRGLLSRHGDQHEQHADAVMTGTATAGGPALPVGVADGGRDALETELAGLGTGTALPDPVRGGIEHRLD